MHVVELSNTVFEGANRVYLFGADGGSGPLTLVDAGFDEPAVRESLRAGLADAGVAVADVEQVLVTHFHRDHAGLAGWVQAESDATVRAHERDAPLVARDLTAREALHRLQGTYFDRWAMPTAKREAFRESVEVDGLDDADGDADDGSAGTDADGGSEGTDADGGSEGTDADGDTGGSDVDAGDAAGPTVEPFSDGATFRAGERELRARHLPGHADGHCGFESADGRTLWSGDCVLPQYTPNVGGADVRVERPLATYAESLAAVVDAGYERAYPGHRDPIADPTARASEILAHHRERTRNVLGVLDDADEPLSTWAVSAALFGDLHSVHILHGPGEAHAHLDHLLAHGLVDRTDWRYRLAAGVDPDAVDLDDLFPVV